MTDLFIMSIIFLFAGILAGRIIGVIFFSKLGNSVFDFLGEFGEWVHTFFKKVYARLLPAHFLNHISDSYTLNPDFFSLFSANSLLRNAEFNRFLELFGEQVKGIQEDSISPDRIISNNLKIDRKNVVISVLYCTYLIVLEGRNQFLEQFSKNRKNALMRFQALEPEIVKNTALKLCSVVNSGACYAYKDPHQPDKWSNEQILIVGHFKQKVSHIFYLGVTPQKIENISRI